MEATATSQLETERKYDAGPDFVLPDLSELPGYTVTEPVTFHMAATYFDTDDLRLAANKVTLRLAHRRRGRRLAPQAARPARHPAGAAPAPRR